MGFIVGVKQMKLAISIFFLTLGCLQALGKTKSVQNVQPRLRKLSSKSDLSLESTGRQAKSLEQPNQPRDNPGIVNIPGTDIVMQTIHYYKIGVESHKDAGFITWTNEEVSGGGGNYLQLALDPANKPHYEKGGEWYEHIHWFFQPTEAPGFVTIGLRTFPNAFMAVIFDSKTEANHLVLLADNNINDFSVGGSKRNDALFQLIPSEIRGGYYRIKVKSHPQGTITYTEMTYGKYSYYIEVDDDAENQIKYQDGEEWADATRFYLEAID